jgi:hypothetical protein
MFISMNTVPRRPVKQDIKPRVFQFPADQMIWMFETPSERRLLWMIAHYPYIFNMFFLEDMLKANIRASEPDSKLGCALKVLHSLKMKGYLRQSRDLLKLHITLKGQIFRCTSHPAFSLVTILGPIVTFAVFLFTRYNPPVQQPMNTIIQDSSKGKTGDSGNIILHHSVIPKVYDSTLIGNDKIKKKKK